MKAYSITPTLHLVEIEVPKTKAKPVPDTINHLWIYDRSGSMYGVLDGLTKDLVERSRDLTVGDTLSLGWFSGEGQYNWVVKGFKITGDAKDQASLETVIRKNKDTIGMTCFSEILADASKVTADLEDFNPNFALTFFSDGYPCVSNYSREIESIYSAIAKIEGKLTASLLVGYGDWYNKELMSDMATRLGGAVVHSTDLPSFSVSLKEFIEGSRESSPKITVDVPYEKYLGIFSVGERQMINVYKTNKGTINFTPSKKTKDSLFIITEKLTGKEEKVRDLDEMKSTNPFLKGIYGAACYLTQNTRTDLALEVLGAIGDVEVIDRVTNAFTLAEYGKAEKRILRAMARPGERFMEGQKVGYVPPRDAFCMVDLMNMLMSDESAMFYPYHDTFDYKKIGVPSVPREGYPKFQAEKNPACPINSLTWHDTHLNLSVKALIRGTVPLKAGCEKLGLAKNYPTQIFRNYSIVKDGTLNVTTLPISCGILSFDVMKDKGLIESGVRWHDGEVYSIDLTRVPIMNRAMADGKTSAKELCKNAMEEIRLQGELKALKFKLGEVEPQEDEKSLSVQAEKFLEEHGIVRGNFSPPVDLVASTDSYTAKEFEIKIKGCSNLPSVNAVTKKLSGKGKLTLSESLVYAGLEAFEKSPVKKSSAKLQAAWLEEAIEERKEALKEVRQDIQVTKFSVILGRRWFEEFSSRTENEIDVGSNHFTLSLKEVQVEI